MATLGLIGFGAVFGMCALFGLPRPADVPGGRSVTLIGSLSLLGLMAFVVWPVRKIGKRRRRSAG